MSNLIVTIIGIALTAVAAMMTIYYVNSTFQTATTQSTANAIVNEAQQLLAASRLWATNNNQPDVSGMGASGANGTGISMLVNSKALSNWPSLAGTIGVDVNLANPGPQPVTGSVTNSSADFGCYNSNGYVGRIARYLLAYKNSNYVVYYFLSNLPLPYTPPCNTLAGSFISSNSDTTYINHPIIKIAKAVNAALNQVPAGSPMAAVGLPYAPAGSSVISGNFYDTASGISSSKIYTDASGNLLVNYCYLANIGGSVGVIACVFGPS